METTDLRTEFTKETKTRFNIECIAYNEYADWLEQRLVKLLTIPDVNQQREQLLAFCDHLNTYAGMEEIRFDFMMQDFIDKSQ
jgi:hypothetical protein